MSDRLDERIQAAVVELVEAAPPAHPYSHVEARRRGSGIGLRAGMVRMATAAAAVLLVGFLGVWIGQGVMTDGPPERGSPMEAVPEGAIPLPEDHRAGRLLEEGNLEELRRNCSSGGTRYGPAITCLVHDGGVLAIVPLTMPADMEASVEISSLEEPVVVPLPHVPSEGDPPAAGELFGVPHEGGRYEITLLHDGEPAGAGMEGGIPSDGPEESPQEVIPVPEDHAARELLASGTERCSDFTPPDEVVMTSQRSGGLASVFASEVCLVWDRGVVAVVALEFPDDSWVRVESASLPRPVEVPLAVGQPFAIEHDGGRLMVQFYRHEELPEGFGGIGLDDFPGRGVIEIPEDHVVFEILEGDPTYREITDRSGEMGVEHLCGGGRSLRYCVIWDDGVVVMIPYSAPAGVTVQMTSNQRRGELEVELVEDEMFAYWVGEGWFVLGIERDGELSTTSAEFPNTGGGTNGDVEG